MKATTRPATAALPCCRPASPFFSVAFGALLDVISVADSDDVTELSCVEADDVVPFSRNMPGDKVGWLVLLVVVGGSVEDVVGGCDVVVGTELVEVVVGVDDVDVVVGVALVVGCCVVVGCGVGVCVLEEGCWLLLLLLLLPLPPPLPPPPEPSNAMIFAVLPLGTVTTQNAESPAPIAAILLSTLPEPEGSIWHGNPLQPPPGHSILTPKPGLLPFRPEDSQIGFQPSLTNVWPLESVLAPATNGLQLPTGVLESPQTQPSEPVPGGLM